MGPAGGAGRWPCRARARRPGADAPGPGGHRGHGGDAAQPLCLVLLAEAAGHVGQVEEGLRLLAEALTALEANGQGDLLAEAYRLQGEFLLRQAVPDAAQAEACFQQALAIARRQQAKSWELRAATSLAACGSSRASGRGPRAPGADLWLVHYTPPKTISPPPPPPSLFPPPLPHTTEWGVRVKALH